jgi:5-methyltetrahydropteroyltriglutamate--homocysteine methyltransferase
MRRSTDRILTTHAGRLPNPDHIAAIQRARTNGDQATFDRPMQAGVADRVHKQLERRNDIHRDGKFWKAHDEIYYNSWVTGIEMRPLQPGEGASILVHQQERHMPEFQDFYAVYDQLGNIPRSGFVKRRVPRSPLCNSGGAQTKEEDDAAEYTAYPDHSYRQPAAPR